MCVANHAEQGDGLCLVVDDPIRVEYLVTAMFGVGLREHHQFDVGGVASELVEVVYQVVDLVDGKCQAQFLVRVLQCKLAALEDVHAGQRLWCTVFEYLVFDTVDVADDGFGHAVMQQWQQDFLLSIAQRFAALALEEEHDAAFDALHLGQAAMLGDVGGFGRPR